MSRLFVVLLIVVLGIVAYGFGVVDTLADIRKTCPDLYEALKARVREEDHATD